MAQVLASAAQGLGGLCLVVMLTAFRPGDLPNPQPEKKELPRVGMTMGQVRQLLGPPRRIARQVLYQRYLEQWHYDQPAIAWIEFDCRRGQEAVLQTVHSSGPADR